MTYAPRTIIVISALQSLSVKLKKTRPFIKLSPETKIFTQSIKSNKKPE